MLKSNERHTKVDKREEGKRDFLMGLIKSKIANGESRQRIAALLNIECNELETVIRHLSTWEEEQKEKEYGIADVVTKLMKHYPQYSQEFWARELGISVEKLRYLIQLKDDTRSN